MLDSRIDPSPRDEFKEQLLEEMRESILRHEKREYRRLGCLEGLELARELKTLEDFEKTLLERRQQELEMRSGAPEPYWRYRCATAQVEHVYERMKVLTAIERDDYSESLSAMAFKDTARIVKAKAEEEGDFF